MTDIDNTKGDPIQHLLVSLLLARFSAVYYPKQSIMFEVFDDC